MLKMKSFKTRFTLPHALIISIGAMLFAMVFSLRILNSRSYLLLSYSIAYLAQCLAFLFVFLKEKPKIHKSFLIYTGIYTFILAIPMVRNAFLGINTSLLDYANVVIKAGSFFLFVGLFSSLTVEKKGFVKIMHFIVLLSVCACFFSVFFEIEEILSIPKVKSLNALRVRSFFSNRNQFAAFLVTAFVANCFLLENKPKSFIRFLVAFLQLFFLLLTFSRAALISAFIFFLLLLLQSKYQKIVLLCTTALVSILVILFFSSSSVASHIHYLLRFENIDSGRSKVWRYAWDVIKDHPVTGVGFYTGVAMAQSKGLTLTQFHNVFMDAWASGGIFELIFLLVLMSFILVRWIPRCSYRPYVKIYRSAFLAFLAYSMVESSNFFSLSFGNTLYTVFFVSLPLLLSQKKPSTIEPRVPESTQLENL